MVSENHHMLCVKVYYVKLSNFFEFLKVQKYIFLTQKYKKNKILLEQKETALLQLQGQPTSAQIYCRKMQ